MGILDGLTQGNGILAGLPNWMGNNSNTLLALGSGLASGANWSQGLANGFAGAQKGHQEDIAQQMLLRKQAALAQIAQGNGPIDYSQAARALLAAGDAPTGVSMLQMGQAAKNHADTIGIQRGELAVKQAAENRAENEGKTLYPGQTLVNPITGKIVYQGDPEASGMLNDAALDMMADQYLAGDKSVFANIGRGAQSSQNLARLRNRISQKMQAAGRSGAEQAATMVDFAAQSKAAGTSAVREANVQSSIEEARNTFPLALQRSRELPRGQFVPLNRAIQMIQAGTSNPALARFVTANQGVITAYSQAMSRTGVNSVNAQQHAEHLLSTATSPEAYEAVIHQMEQEMDAARRAPETVRKSILGRVSGKQDQPISPTPIKTLRFNPATGKIE